MADTKSWEQIAVTRMDMCKAVKCYARNDHLECSIPYEFQGVDHAYEPDFLVDLVNDLHVVLEIKGFADEQTRAKHTAAQRWVHAVNNWGQLGRWHFHVCRDPQMLEREMNQLLQATGQP